jgi:hypothetical protein
LRGMSNPAFRASLPVASLTTTLLAGGEAGPRGHASTNFGPEVGHQPRIRCAHTPPSFFSRVKLQSNRRVLRDLFQPGATPLGFSIINGTLVLMKNQEVCRDILSEAVAIFSRP